MSKSLTKAETIDRLADKTGLTKNDVSAVLSAIADLAYEEAENSFTIPGIGKLTAEDRPARKGRNPRTGETIDIPARKAIKFKAAKAFKDEVGSR